MEIKCFPKAGGMRGSASVNRNRNRNRKTRNNVIARSIMVKIKSVGKGKYGA